MNKQNFQQLLNQPVPVWNKLQLAEKKEDEFL
jgi:hypothetical protein